jgi:hypothetical protein
MQRCVSTFFVIYQRNIVLGVFTGKPAPAEVVPEVAEVGVK